MRILVIDEEAFVREALRRVLSGSSTVIIANNAATGLKLLRESPTDLVIIDVVLAAGDGVAAIREIRSEYPHIHVIAIAGSGDAGVSSYRPEAISTHAYLAASAVAGAHGTLAKPFETSELRELIERTCATQASS